MSNQSGDWREVIFRLGLAGAIFFIAPMAFLAIYLKVFNAPPSSVQVHIYLILNLLACLAGGRLLFSLLLGPFLYKAASVIAIAATGLGIVVFYGLALVGLKYWGRVATIDLATVYLNQSSHLLAALGYRPEVLAGICVATGGVLLFLIYGFLKRYDWVLSFRKMTSKLVVTTVSLCLLGVAGITAATLADRGWGRAGEPVSLSLFPEQGTMVMQSHPLELMNSARIDSDEKAVRSAYATSKTARHSNVILIVADALRADHLSLLGYRRETTPNLEATARKSKIRLATSAVSVCNESSCGLRGLASSRYLDRQATSPITLQEILRSHGYRVNLIFSGDHTNFYGLREVYGPVDSYFDGTSQTERYINDDRLVLDHLRGFVAFDGRPTMFHFHLMSSHVLGSRFEETPKFGPEQSYTRLGAESMKPEMPKLATNFYDRGVLQVDAVIEKILQQLDERGYLQDALVIITGDHGESLGERGTYVHTHSVWEEALRVPLLLLSFGAAAPGTFEHKPVVSQVDIAPTVLRALEMPIPENWEGMPLQAAEVSRIVYFQQAQQLGLIDSRDKDKLYKHWIDLRTGQQFTFDLRADPGEIHNVAFEVENTRRKEWQELLENRSSALAPEFKERLMNPAPKPPIH